VRPAESADTATAITAPVESTTSSVLAVSPSRAYVDAAVVLSSIPVALEHRGEPHYSRDLFNHWIDIDGCDTRTRVLVRDGDLGSGGWCDVAGRVWVSWYDGVILTDAQNLDVDHLVPLKEAWDSGAWEWDQSRREAYANDLTDPRSLQAVSAESNRSKADKDPSNWLPRGQAAVCRYVGDWIAVKARWSLSMDQSEAGRIRNVLRERCPRWKIATWTPSPR